MIPRAERFTTQLAIRYRTGGQVDWYEARTENISRTGVLFQGERLLRPNTPVEMRLEMLWLPPLEPASVAEVVWCGSVVRTVPPAAKDARSALAVSIAHSTLSPGKNALEV
jgi:hypothetical protein